MKERLLIAAVLVFAVAYALLNRFSAPMRPSSVLHAGEAAQLRLYRDAAGREVRVATPLLDEFRYAGDAELCAALREMTKADVDAARELLEECESLSTGTATEISQKRIGLATVLGDRDEEYTYSFPSGGTERNKRVALALSVLRSALDAASPAFPEQAFSALNSAWVARNVGDSFTRYNPPFLFGAALRAEAGEAMLTLCPLAGRADCDVYVPSGMPSALEELGRWKSDEALLLRSAELLEREYRAVKTPDRRRELKFAQEFTAKLGYANEINPGNGSAHARRGVRPLEDWLAKYESSTSQRELQYIYSGVGVAYGRIAANTVQRSDAEKAVKFNTLVYEIAAKLNKSGPDWTTLANLGSDTLLLAEIDRQEAGFQEALKLHRDAYAMTQTFNAQEASAYMNMVLARTLQHYAKADLPAVADSQKVAMLEEAISLAQGVKPLFEQTGTASYLKITNRVLDAANVQLGKLRRPTAP